MISSCRAEPWPPPGRTHVRQRAVIWPSAGSLSWPPSAGSWYVDEPVPPRNGDDDALAAWGAAWDDWRRNRSPVPPDAPAFTPPASPGDSARVDLHARRLQVIVKLAAVHLTPGKPGYPGGSWHVEGMMNERIVSTGIYYWDSENITESRPSFRAAAGDPAYEQNDRNGVREVYGLADEDAMNQVLGSAETRAWPRPGIPEHPPASRRPVPPRGPLPAGTSQDPCVLPGRPLGDDHLDIRRAATAALVPDADHDTEVFSATMNPSFTT